ncbi:MULTISPECIES: BrnT family toxin [Cysteiniphilum]|uniref:BrnT family toxin n=1 Tax=Cysteiniphilum litorale TaxID=2056700 RepID=A0A8J2Z7D4_9GAMM|nr:MULTISPECIES: BrnT family toxin [Cysteiniphilum]WHN65241.1 BrnT family toxin [Cysteiniphilum sp. QT6929]GGG09204.1 hypothetical protein GCM10010995_28510 [Cysteiniphilum litorale]
MFEWDEKKNKQLKQERHISFEQIVTAIENGDLLAIDDNVNHPNQSILRVRIGDYVYSVATEQRNNNLRLITAYADRKQTKRFGGDTNA